MAEQPKGKATVPVTWPVSLKNPTKVSVQLMDTAESEARRTPMGAENRRLELAQMQLLVYLAGLEQSVIGLSKASGISPLSSNASLAEGHPLHPLTDLMTWARRETIRLLSITPKELTELEQDPEDGDVDDDGLG